MANSLVLKEADSTTSMAAAVTLLNTALAAEITAFGFYNVSAQGGVSMICNAVATPSYFACATTLQTAG